MRLSIPLAVLVFLGVSACGGGDNDEGSQTPTTVAAGNMETAPETTEATTTEATTAEAAPEDPRRIRISFRNGELGGDSGAVRVRLGEEVRLTVRADVEEEVHVHGYDLAVAVAPGRPARISFAADMAGTFTIELEELHLHIATLRVRE